jgi:hypothetical protein
MNDVPWTRPATLYSRVAVAGGSPRERALGSGFDLLGAIRFAMGGSDGPLSELVIKLDDGSREYGPREIEELADLAGLPMA